MFYFLAQSLHFDLLFLYHFLLFPSIFLLFRLSSVLSINSSSPASPSNFLLTSFSLLSFFLINSSHFSLFIDSCCLASLSIPLVSPLYRFLVSPLPPSSSIPLVSPLPSSLFLSASFPSSQRPADYTDTPSPPVQMQLFKSFLAGGAGAGRWAVVMELFVYIKSSTFLFHFFRISFFVSIPRTSMRSDTCGSPKRVGSLWKTHEVSTCDFRS